MDPLSANPLQKLPARVPFLYKAPPMTDSTSRDAGLVRSVGTLALATNIVNCVIGAGIFKLPNEMAGLVGAYAPLAYVCCALGMGAVVACWAEAGSRVPTSGGAYGYIEVALGPMVGWISGACIWLTGTLAQGSILAGFTDSLINWVPSVAPFRTGVILLVQAIVLTANLASVRTSSKVVSAATFVKLIPLVIFMLIGVFGVTSDNISLGAAPSAGDFGRCVVVGLFAFTGMETALGASGEVINPARTVPRALLFAMGFIAIAYIFIQIVAQGTLGADLSTSTAPLADGITRVSPFLRPIVLAGMLASMFGYIMGSNLGGPRMLFAFARDGFLPAVFGKLHPKTHVPYIAIIAHAVFACTLALAGDFLQLAVLSTLAACAAYILGCIAAFVLRKRNYAAAGEPLVIPGTPVLAVIGTVAMLLIAAQSTAKEGIYSAIAVAVMIAIYFARSIVRKRPTAAAT